MPAKKRITTFTFFAEKLVTSSMISQIIMKEKPKKSPRVPPTSAIKEDKLYDSSLVSTKTKGEVF